MTQPQPAPPSPEAVVEEGPVVLGASFKEIMLGSGPKFAREGFGPVIAFYLGWKMVGLLAGIALATTVGFVAYWAARRDERSGNMAKIALGFVMLQAVVGLIANDAKAFLAPPVLISAGLGTAFVVSALMGRPLAGVFAEETYPFPPEVRASETFRRVFGRVSMAWGVYLLVRSVVRIVVLTQGTVDAYVAINFLTGAPFMAAMMTWSFWYGVRGFRRSEEWGWAFG